MHTLITGVTETGKTTLAHALARNLASRGQPIIVYDPVVTKTAVGTWPDSAVMFSDEESFFDYLSRPDVYAAHVFIDEAGDLFHLGKRHNFWLLTRGRHFGFQAYLIAQRPKMLPPTVRTQCARAYVFRLSPDDMAMIGEDMGHGGVDKIILDRGDFIVLSSGQASIKRANLFKLISKGS